MVEMKIFSRAYASTANFGPGFDVYAMALDAFNDVIAVEPDAKYIKISGPYADGLSADYVARYINYMVGCFRNYFRLDEVEVGVEIFKGIPVSVGLGSSAAASVAFISSLASAYGVDASIRDIQLLASIGEEYVAGARHIDNVTASLVGGFVVSCLEVESIVISPPPWLSILLLIPSGGDYVFYGKTKYARSILSDCYSISDCVYNIRRASYLIAGLLRGDPKLIRFGLSDKLVEPYRYKLIPFPKEVLEKLRSVDGVLGMFISGAGPTVSVVVDDRLEGVDVDIMEILDRNSVDCKVVYSGVGGGVYTWRE